MDSNGTSYRGDGVGSPHQKSSTLPPPIHRTPPHSTNVQIQGYHTTNTLVFIN
jgi:hypothetical protein